MSIIDTKTLSFYQVQNLMVPNEGPKAVPLVLDFSQQPQYDLNLQNIESRNFISQIQSVFIDNRNNAQPVTITFDGSNQTIQCAPNRQGYFIVLCPNPASMHFVSTGLVKVSFQLLNFPVTNANWPSVTGA